MKFVLTVTYDNSDFVYDAVRRLQLARILRDVALQVQRGDDDFCAVFDLNGNAVGNWRIK